MMPGQGTSPRTRGKHHQAPCPDSGSRNIPAHAGKTRGYVQYIPPTWEHPRARGENYAYETDRDAGKGTSPRTRENRRAAAIVSSICGTSPRTRGKQVTASHQGNTAGNIPAHAGKTNKNPQLDSYIEEHPRARGENGEGNKGVE